MFGCDLIKWEAIPLLVRALGTLESLEHLHITGAIRDLADVFLYALEGRTYPSIRHLTVPLSAGSFAGSCPNLRIFTHQLGGDVDCDNSTQHVFFSRVEQLQIAFTGIAAHCPLMERLENVLLPNLEEGMSCWCLILFITTAQSHHVT
jgi:hypothetical protein